MNEIQFTSICIDNSIFKSLKYNFEEGTLKLLSQFKNNSIEFILPTVIWGEVNTHLISDTIEAEKRINELKNNVISKNYFPKLKSNGLKISNYSFETPKSIAQKRLNGFKQDTGLRLIKESEYLDIDELLKGYFDNKSPFELREKKKYEFPDAIALYALENYAQKNNKFILLVSVDEGWLNFCKNSRYLYCEKKLSEGLDKINQQNNLDFEPIKQYANKLIHTLKSGKTENYLNYDEIKDFIEQYSFELSFYPSQYEVDDFSEKIEVDDFNIENINLVEINAIENTFTIDIELNFTLYVSVDFNYYHKYEYEDAYLHNQVEDIVYDERINILQTIKIDKNLRIDQYELLDINYEYSSGPLEIGISEYY